MKMHVYPPISLADYLQEPGPDVPHGIRGALHDVDRTLPGHRGLSFNRMAVQLVSRGTSPNYYWDKQKGRFMMELPADCSAPVLLHMVLHSYEYILTFVDRKRDAIDSSQERLKENLQIYLTDTQMEQVRRSGMGITSHSYWYVLAAATVDHTCGYELGTVRGGPMFECH